MSAWIGSEDLDAALKPVGCGCEMRALANQAAGVEADALAAEAPDVEAAWGCPAQGAPFPPDTDHLDPARREVLECVGRFAGARGMTTCPRRYASEPWVGAVLEARLYRDKGQLQVLHPLPSAVLLHAIGVVDHAIDRRLRTESDRQREEAEEARRRAGMPTTR